MKYFDEMNFYFIPIIWFIEKIIDTQQKYMYYI